MTKKPKNTSESKETTTVSASEADLSWKMIKDDIRKSWNTISEDELEDTSGDRRQIVNFLQKKNGVGLDDYSRKVDFIFAKHEGAKRPAL